MNSIAQQAVTNGYGNSENLRAQPASSSFFVVRYSNAAYLDEPADRVGKIGIGIGDAHGAASPIGRALIR